MLISGIYVVLLEEKKRSNMGNLELIVTFIFVINAAINVFLIVRYDYKHKKYGYTFSVQPPIGRNSFSMVTYFSPFWITIRIIKEFKEKIKKEELKE